MRNEARRRLPTTCQEPFERGPLLCSVCRNAPGIEGLSRCSRMIVHSAPMRALMGRAAKIAPSSAPVVILGESGTGKEVLARALHANGPRRRRPFVAVNVAALPGELLESELFGHAKGAFTGAISANRGLLAAADGGTLLLDEVAEMTPALQVKLLRAIEDGEVRPVGATQPIRLDVRILCATNEDLARRVDEGAFRADLYYRLKVFTLRVPPLRERRDDVEPLVRAFLEGAGRPDLTVSRAAMERLLAHTWPGNIRELANAVLHAITLATGRTLAPEHFPEDVLHPKAPPASLAGGTLAEVERAHIERTLEACGGNRAIAARVLGIGRNTLWRKLRAYGLHEA